MAANVCNLPSASNGDALLMANVAYKIVGGSGTMATASGVSIVTLAADFATSTCTISQTGAVAAH